MLQLRGFDFGKKLTDFTLFLRIVRDVKFHMLTCYNSGAILHDYHSIELTLIFFKRSIHFVSSVRLLVSNTVS